MKKFIYTEIKRSYDEQVETIACACFDCCIINKLAHAPHLDTYLEECNPEMECEFHEEKLSN